MVRGMLRDNFLGGVVARGLATQPSSDRVWLDVLFALARLVALAVWDEFFVSTFAPFVQALPAQSGLRLIRPALSSLFLQCGGGGSFVGRAPV